MLGRAPRKDCRVLTRIAAVALPLAVAALVFLPLWLDRPFAAQTTRSLAAAYDLRRWAPAVSLAAAAVMTAIAFTKWRRPRNTAGAIAVTVSWAIVLVGAWFARQNLFEWVYKPLPHAAYVAARDASFVQPADLVLAVSLNGESAAYPIRQLAYHHVVNDVVGNVPIAVTY